MERSGFISVASSHSAKRAKECLPASLETGSSLAKLLVMTRALCHQSLYCQWQAMEPEFTNLHSMFEQIYQSLRMATDVIATRLSELHYDVPSQFTKPSWGFANDETESPEDLITDMISKHYSCAHEAKRVLQAADAAGDERTAHIALQRAGAHEKSAWLLSALIDSKPATHSVM